MMGKKRLISVWKYLPTARGFIALSFQITLLIAVMNIAVSLPVFAQEKKTDFWVFTGYEVDTNVLKLIDAEGASQVSVLGWRGKARFNRAGKLALNFSFQGGFKRPLNTPEGIHAGTVVVNQGDLSFNKKLTNRIAAGVEFNIKSRNVFDRSDAVLLQEESYHQGSARFISQFVLTPKLSNTISYAREFLNFSDTEILNYSSDQIMAVFRNSFSKRLSTSFGFGWARYSFNRQALKVTVLENEIIFEILPDEQLDKTYQLNFGFQYYRDVLITFEIGYQRNDSNNSGSSFENVVTTLKLGKQLTPTWFINFYSNLLFKNFSGNTAQVDPSDLTERNYSSVVTGITRQITENLEGSIVYGWFDNGTNTNEFDFSKSLLTFSISYRI